MSSPDRGALRAVRSAVLALFVAGLSSAGHAAAGGQLPGAVAGAGLLAAVAACCWLATRWRVPVGAAVLLLAGSQVVLHAVLEAVTPAHRAGAGALPALGAAHAGHLGAAGAAATPSMGSMATASPALWLGGPTAADATMLLAHTAVAVALALVYSRGEDAVWALCAWLAPLAAVVVALLRLPVVPSRRPLPAGAAVVVAVQQVVLRAVRRRGPPVPVAG